MELASRVACLAFCDIAGHRDCRSPQPGLRIVSKNTIKSEGGSAVPGFLAARFSGPLPTYFFTGFLLLGCFSTPFSLISPRASLALNG